jgi:hypothetical protein
MCERAKGRDAAHVDSGRQGSLGLPPRAAGQGRQAGRQGGHQLARRSR